MKLFFEESEQNCKQAKKEKRSNFEEHVGLTRDFRDHPLKIESCIEIECDQVSKNRPATSPGISMAVAQKLPFDRKAAQ